MTEDARRVHWDHLSQFEQEKYISHAHDLIDKGLSDEDVEVLARKVYVSMTEKALHHVRSVV